MIGFSYLFNDPIRRKIALDYFKVVLEKNFHPKEKLHEIYWPITLASMFRGEGGLATDCLERTQVLKDKNNKQFIKSLILFHEKRYTNSLLEFEKTIESIKSSSAKGEKEEKNFILIESYRYIGKIYYIQNLKKKGNKYFQRAYKLDKEDVYIKDELRRIGILSQSKS